MVLRWIGVEGYNRYSTVLEGEGSPGMMPWVIPFVLVVIVILFIVV
jgi:hypothetical protein